MGVGYNPQIVTDGLVMYLDAANSRSYPGSGSTWTDLIQGITFSSYGTQTPVETISGAKSFAFNGSGYWESISGHEKVDMGGDCTLLMWIYDEDVITRRTIFEKAGTSYSSYQQEIAVTWEGDETLSWYSRYSPAYDYGISSGLTLNSWNLMGIKMSTGRTASSRTGFYSKNGNSWASNYFSGSNTALVSAGAIRIGTGYAGAVENGNIALVMCYNKMLSDAEIQQNFNALRGRFGI